MLNYIITPSAGANLVVDDADPFFTDEARPDHNVP